MLSALGQAGTANRESVWLPSLRRGHDDWRTLLHSLGELFGRGVRVDWQGFDRDYPRRQIDLPTYPFHRARYWAPDTVVSSPQIEQICDQLDQWLHRIVWRETPRLGTPLAAQNELEPVWLIVGKPSTLRSGLERQLRERQQQCVLAAASSNFARQDNQFTFCADNPQHFDQLFHELKLTQQHPLRGVLLLTDSDGAAETDVQLLDCQVALHLAQALGRLADPSPRFYLVTRGGQQPLTEGAGPRPEQAALWGLARRRGGNASAELHAHRSGSGRNRRRRAAVW